MKLAIFVLFALVCSAFSFSMTKNEINEAHGWECDDDTATCSACLEFPWIRGTLEFCLEATLLVTRDSSGKPQFESLEVSVTKDGEPLPGWTVDVDIPSINATHVEKCGEFQLKAFHFPLHVKGCLFADNIRFSLKPGFCACLRYSISGTLINVDKDFGAIKFGEVDECPTECE